MPRNFNFEWKGVTAKDPRVVMRAIIGLLLAANLVAAVIAFKPFGGSAEDLRRQTEMQRSQLARAQANLANTRSHVPSWKGVPFHQHWSLPQVLRRFRPVREPGCLRCKFHLAGPE